MPIGKAQTVAWQVHDILHHALVDLWSDCHQPNAPKPSPEDLRTLCLLSAELEHWQDRIRIHRRVPLPGTARPKRKGIARAREQVERGRPLKAGEVPANFIEQAPEADGATAMPSGAPSPDAPSQEQGIEPSSIEEPPDLDETDG